MFQNQHPYSYQTLLKEIEVDIGPETKQAAIREAAIAKYFDEKVQSAEAIEVVPVHGNVFIDHMCKKAFLELKN